MPELPPYPESISGCSVQGALREGPATAVLRARDSLGLPVELHLFAADAVAARIPREIFFDEVRRTAAIHSEHIGAVVNAGEKGPWLFVAQKASDGASLAQIFARGGAMDEVRALAIFAGVADGLSALELAGLRHGGLEPRSVALPGGGQVLLSLRRLVPTDLAARDPCYLAPEEARGLDGSIASDLYALGLMLFSALLGRPVVEGPAAEVRTRLARGEIPDPGLSLPGVHGTTLDVLRALLAPGPADRPRTAADAASRMRTARATLEGSPIPAAPPVAAAAIAVAPPVASAPPPPPPPPPPAMQAPRAAVAAAAALRPKRATVRLVFDRRGVPVVHELLDPITWIGFGDGGVPVARSERFAGASAQVEVGPEGTFLFPTGTPPAPRVAGKEVARHDLRVGDRFTVSGTPFLFEKATRLSEEEGGASVRRPPGQRARKAAALLGVGLAAAAFGWAAARWVAVQQWRRDEYIAAQAREREISARLGPLATAPATPAARAAREEQALRLLDEARSRRLAGDATGAAERLRTLAREFADTAAAAAAQDEDGSVGRGSERDAAEELARVQARAEALAAEGRPAEGEDLLLEFARRHEETLVGDRAQRTARALMQVAADGVAALLDRAQEAVERQDWGTAVACVDRAVRTATGEMLDRARRERERVYRLRPRVAPDAPAEAPGGDAPGGAPPVTGPVPPRRGEPPPPTEKEPAIPTRDEEAATLFRASREAAEAGRLGEAERGFYRLLTEYTDTAAVRNYGPEIRDRLSDVVKKGHGVAGLLRGHTTWQGSRVTLTYEWEDAADAEDWEHEYPFMVPTKGTFTVERGDVTGRGAAAFLHRARFLPGSVTMSFRMRPGIPPQDMGAVFMEPRDLMNHLMFTVGNQFFTIGKGAKEQKLPGNVIFVFGKGMWRATDPDMVGFVRTGVSEEPKVPSGKWIEIEVSKDKGQARFVVGGKRIEGKSVGDNKYELTGVKPGLFVLLSEARFDDVVIEGELDPAWIQEERARVFPGIR